MNYSVSFKGTFRFRKGIRENAFEKNLEEILNAYSNPIYDVSLDGSIKVLSIRGFFFNYSEENMYSILGNISKNLSEAEIEYIGEDATFWRHKKYPGKNLFVEQNGKVVYDEQHCVDTIE